MQNQRGLVGVGVLIAILVGLLVLGGGAYFVMQQNTPSQTATDIENLDTLPTTNNQLQQQANNKPTGNVAPSSPASAQWKTYTNVKLNYSVQYPANWVVNFDDTTPYFYLKFSSPDYSEVATCTGQPECENTPVIESGAKLEIHTFEVYGLAENLLKLGQNDRNVGFKTERWATVDGRKALVTEFKRWLEPQKDAFQQISVQIPTNGAQMISVDFKFDSFDKENEDIFAKVLGTFNISETKTYAYLDSATLKSRKSFASPSGKYAVMIDPVSPFTFSIVEVSSRKVLSDYQPQTGNPVICEMTCYPFAEWLGNTTLIIGSYSLVNNTWSSTNPARRHEVVVFDTATESYRSATNSEIAQFDLYNDTNLSWE